MEPWLYTDVAQLLSLPAPGGSSLALPAGRAMRGGGFLLLALIAGATVAAGADKMKEDADYLEDEGEDEDYDYEEGDEGPEEDGKWPEEWGDPELDDYDYDEPHGGEL